MISLVLEPVDGHPLIAALPGQFIVLRLRPTPDVPTLMRSYSLSGEPSAERYRVSVKREAHGAAGAYIDDRLQVGDVLDASAARGSFTLRPGDAPVVFLSAGIGVTPMLAMLHALAAGASAREVWWLYGARDRREHPFADETRTLLKALANGHRHICYSSPDPEDRPELDFDARGRLDKRVLQELGVPRNADFYICGPPAFMSDLTVGLAVWGIAASRIYTENFGAGPSKTPGIAASPRRPPHLPAGPAGAGPLVSFARSGLDVHWEPASRACLSLPKRATYLCDGRAERGCETGLVVGTVSYRPHPIDAPVDGNVLICCCQPQGDVVIDL